MIDTSVKKRLLLGYYYCMSHQHYTLNTQNITGDGEIYYMYMLFNLQQKLYLNITPLHRLLTNMPFLLLFSHFSPSHSFKNLRFSSHKPSGEALSVEWYDSRILHHVYKRHTEHLKTGLCRHFTGFVLFIFSAFCLDNCYSALPKKTCM